HLLFRDGDRSINEQVTPDKHLFPRRMAVQDYFIQEPRYLQCYAEQFCRFIELYKEQGIDIRMVMYQNEAYSYTPYPGCPWTTEGILRFNLEYLAPTLRQRHPDVELCLGTFNTNRYDHVSQLLADPRMAENIVGVGFQWEGGQILPRIRAEHPQYRYISTESECGNGSMDWSAAEHTFHLINHYVGNGCSEYNNWNLVLCDRGESSWGWRQNALVRVNSADRTFEYVPEWYAYRHYSQFIGEGTRIVGFRPTGADRTPVLVALTPAGKTVVVAGNLTDTPRTVSVQLGQRVLTCALPPHSLNSFVQR
ncbi:MAG: beta-glycosidase, partial [Bacteroidaceae bacterium]|nr:beta-glycosidase [Bacteroidaceae bacterium]